jgi:hypothetical protein
VADGPAIRPVPRRADLLEAENPELACIEQSSGSSRTKPRSRISSRSAPNRPPDCLIRVSRDLDGSLSWIPSLLTANTLQSEEIVPDNVVDKTSDSLELRRGRKSLP